AAQSAGGVVSAPLNEFIRKNGTFSAACRIVPDLPKWMVLNIPDTLKSRVKESNDVKLLIFEITSAKNTTP
ncbi:MAG TPA: hypothetical protein VJK50_02190, partial [Patescibacteria group bacterium]|nr:hypothetical protein [Patescibacteria group bacterium]